MERYFERKFIGGAKIPVYNGFKNYNYYDTMASFVFWDFSEHHRKAFKVHMKQISDHKEVGEELTGFDVIKYGS